MNNLLRMCALLATAAALAFAVPVFAQDIEPASPAKDTTDSTQAQDAKPSSSQEVEINEDTYRQFMELKDANRQGDIIPETVFKPGSGLQKLEKLPEASQKHLRNELREIIVDGEPWQPGDETADYPYTPSAAAGKDPALRKQEMEAWGELVDSYNQREAQIYANMSGNRAAMSTQDGSSGQRGESADSAGRDGEGREGAPGQPPEHDASPDDRDTAGAFSPDAVRNPHAENASGVSQNALEFLQGLGGGAENAAGQEPGARQGTGGRTDIPTATGATQNAMEFLNQAGAQAGSPAASSQGESGATGPSRAMDGGQQSQQGSPQSMAQESARDPARGEEQAAGEQAGEQGETETRTGQQTETAATTASVPVPESDVTVSSSVSEDESTAGSSQNALEYLQGADSQAGAPAEKDANTSPPTGTLNIRDLLNAQGVGGPAGTGTPGPAPDEEKPTDDSNDKDGGGR